MKVATLLQCERGPRKVKEESPPESRIGGSLSHNVLAETLDSSFATIVAGSP